MDPQSQNNNEKFDLNVNLMATTQKQSVGLLDLPDELLLYIFKYTYGKDVLNSSLVCRKLYAICRDHEMIPYVESSLAAAVKSEFLCGHSPVNYINFRSPIDAEISGKQWKELTKKKLGHVRTLFLYQGLDEIMLDLIEKFHWFPSLKYLHIMDYGTHWDDDQDTLWFEDPGVYNLYTGDHEEWKTSINAKHWKSIKRAMKPVKSLSLAYNMPMRAIKQYVFAATNITELQLTAPQLFIIAQMNISRPLILQVYQLLLGANDRVNKLFDKLLAQGHKLEVTEISICSRVTIPMHQVSCLTKSLIKKPTLNLQYFSRANEDSKNFLPLLSKISDITLSNRNLQNADILTNHLIERNLKWDSLTDITIDLEDDAMRSLEASLDWLAKLKTVAPKLKRLHLHSDFFCHSDVRNMPRDIDVTDFKFEKLKILVESSQIINTMSLYLSDLKAILPIEFLPILKPGTLEIDFLTIDCFYFDDEEGLEWLLRFSKGTCKILQLLVVNVNLVMMKQKFVDALENFGAQYPVEIFRFDNWNDSFKCLRANKHRMLPPTKPLGGEDKEMKQWIWEYFSSD